MNDYACILIWDAHMRMGHNIGPYAFGISHTRMVHPIRVKANIRIWGRTVRPFYSERRQQIKERARKRGRLRQTKGSVLVLHTPNIYK